MWYDSIFTDRACGFSPASFGRFRLALQARQNLFSTPELNSVYLTVSKQIINKTLFGDYTLKPKTEFIKIKDNEKLIKLLLEDLVLAPRVKALDWSKITKQTPNMKVGYPGQHLASLITGVQGARTGARGDDLEDGSEVKSCSRVDQLDSCKDCGNKVLRIETICPHCGSENLKRMDDSKWLFSVKSEEELKLLTKTLDRIFLTIADYPLFSKKQFDTIRFQAFEIWNNCERHKNFEIIMRNYFYKIFLEHIKINPRKTPAPKNFWPFSYQFYLCNPVKVFQATVTNANTKPSIKIDLLVAPETDREILTPELMPISLLGKDELNILADDANFYIIESLLKSEKCFNDFKEIVFKKNMNKKLLAEILPYLDHRARDLLPLRDTDKISESKAKYQRR